MQPKSLKKNIGFSRNKLLMSIPTGIESVYSEDFKVTTLPAH